MADKNFAVTPSVNISRSKFDRNSSHKTSFRLGDLFPVYIDEVLPGDTRSIDISALVRMSTPIYPIMDDIELEFFAFFVPNRLVWSNWKKFMGESNNAGFITTPPVYPYKPLPSGGIPVGCLGDYYGIPDVPGLEVSSLPIRGYFLIYNRWFMDQNVEAPYYVPLTDGSSDALSNYNMNLLKAYKKSDYFTRALPYAQKGNPVSLPLGTTAPLGVGATSYSVQNLFGGTYDKIMLGGTSVGGALGSNASGELYGAVGGATTAGNITDTNLYVDLRNATAATINQLREAFQLQKLLEKDALYGTRLNAHSLV